MFESGKLKRRAEETFVQIAEVGAETAKSLADEERMQSSSAQIWTIFCSILPAYTFVIFNERSRNPSDSDAQNFLSILTNCFFQFVFEYSIKSPIPVNKLLPVPSERQLICKETALCESVHTEMDTAMRAIFPYRMQTYQQDLSEGLRSTSIHAPLDLLAMRLSAHLFGIETPKSIAGYTADQLGIEVYGQTLIPLVNFCNSYS
jgi:hypothetical protein